MGEKWKKDVEGCGEEHGESIKGKDLGGGNHGKARRKT